MRYFFLLPSRKKKNMIPFAIANFERGVMGIHSFHDPARGSISVGLKRIFYCIMKLYETPLTHVYCMHSAVYTYSSVTLRNPRCCGGLAHNPRRALQVSARSAINPIDRVRVQAAALETPKSREASLCMCVCVEEAVVPGSDPTK